VPGLERGFARVDFFLLGQEHYGTAEAVPCYRASRLWVDWALPWQFGPAHTWRCAV